MGNGAALIFGGTDLKPNQVAAVNLTLPKQLKKGAVGTTGADGAGIAKIIAGAGGAVALAVGAGYVVFKPVKAAKI
jgi:hypothetical protein